MTLETLKGGLERLGMSEEDLYIFMLNTKTIVNQLQAAHLLDYALLNQMRKNALYNVFGNPGFVIDTNFDVKNGTAFFYTNGGTLKTFAANGNFDTLTARHITTAKWGAALLSVTAAAAGLVTWAGTSPSAYATEAAAIAALPAVAATETAVGYVTVLAAGSDWVAGTDALAGGSGGTPATTTNYYNSINANATQIGAALATLAETDPLTFARG